MAQTLNKFLFLALALTVLSGCQSVANLPTVISRPSSSKVIVFNARGPGANGMIKSDIYLVNADDGSLQRLTSDGASLNPVWSPDGRYIAFIAKCGYAIMNADGTGQKCFARIDSDRTTEVFAWSPDSRHIAFATSSPTVYSNTEVDMHVASVEAVLQGSSDNVSAKLLYLSGSIYNIGWSPDGHWITFITRPDDVDAPEMLSVIEVRKMLPGTQNLYATSLTEAHESESPTWSPDGKRIVFTSTALYANPEIYMLDAENSFSPIGNNNVVTDKENSWIKGFLTISPGVDDSPRFSPDGLQIAFVSQRDGNNEIYVMNADGSNPLRLTTNQTDDLSPVWSPDGQKIAFKSGSRGSQEIYVMEADGSHLTRLSNNAANDFLPAWSPDGKRLIFISNRDKDFEVYIVNADGTGEKALTHILAGEGMDLGAWYPSWQP